MSNIIKIYQIDCDKIQLLLITTEFSHPCQEQSRCEQIILNHLFKVSYPLIECLPECCHIFLSLFPQVMVISRFTASQALQCFSKKMEKTNHLVISVLSLDRPKCACI